MTPIRPPRVYDEINESQHRFQVDTELARLKGLIDALGDLYLALSGGTLTGNLLFSADNTKDIGATGATRPRTAYVGTSVKVPVVDSGAATDLLLKRNDVTKLTLGDTLATLTVPVRSSAPTGGSGDWEFGIANAVSPTAPNRTITIEIGGTAYYLHAKTTND